MLIDEKVMDKLKVMENLYSNIGRAQTLPELLAVFSSTMLTDCMLAVASPGARTFTILMVSVPTIAAVLSRLSEQVHHQAPFADARASLQREIMKVVRDTYGPGILDQYNAMKARSAAGGRRGGL